MTQKAKSPRRALVREELLTKAAEVFERQGFAQTRIEDISSALDLKRSAIYYYFETKNDILKALVQDFCEVKAEEHKQSVAGPASSASEKLRNLLTLSIRTRTEGGARVRALDTVWTEMPEDIREQFDAARRRIFALHMDVIREGVASGEFRSVDPRLAALGVLGVVNWTSWWYSPDGRDKIEDVIDELVKIAINGLLSTSRGEEMGRSPLEIVELMEKGLGQLKQTLKN
ncbi:MAG: TetR/AcrR family transcriptional regulator [Mesorhizobium sp.]